MEIGNYNIWILSILELSDVKEKLELSTFVNIFEGMLNILNYIDEL